MLRISILSCKVLIILSMFSNRSFCVSSNVRFCFWIDFEEQIATTIHKTRRDLSFSIVLSCCIVHSNFSVLFSFDMIFLFTIWTSEFIVMISDVYNYIVYVIYKNMFYISNKLSDCSNKKRTLILLPLSLDKHVETVFFMQYQVFFVWDTLDYLNIKWRLQYACITCV